jgi:O-antigen ligase
MSNIVILVLALGIAPFAVYLALKRPLIFPLGLYVIMVPFDSLLGTTTTLTRLVAIATGGILLFNMVATRRILAPPKSWTAWALYVTLASLSALWTIDTAGTMLILGATLQLFFFYSILAFYPAERRDVRMLGAIVAASGTILSLAGLATYATGYRTQDNRLSITTGSLILDPNHIAACLLLPIALAVGTLFETRDLRLRFASGAATVIMITALFLTGSRGGLIALAVMMVYLALRTRFRVQILGLMALAGVGSLLQPTVWDRFADKGLQGGSGRLYIWDVGHLALKDFWLRGAGIGAFPAAYNHELLKTYQPVFQGWSRPAHNAYLSAGVELGILGAVLVIYGWWRTWRDARGNVVIEAAIIGLAVAAYFLDMLFLKYVWLAFAMAALVRNVAEPTYLKGGNRQPQLERRAELLAAGASRSRRRFFAHRRRQQPAVKNPQPVARLEA